MPNNLIIQQLIQKIEKKNIDIEILKNNFIHVINSPRQYSLITNYEDLLNVLSKRQNFIDCISILGALLNDDYFYSIIPTYQELLTNSMYIFRNLNLHEFEHSSNKNTLSPPSTIPETVIDLISKSIGKKSNLLASKLGLKEGEIDDLQIEYRHDQETKVRKILERFQSRCDTKSLKFKLLDGLSQARREDLKEDVQVLFSTL